MAAVQETIQLHYKDLIDMALGSTDIGLFNLHLLHTILQCLVVHLNLNETIIDYNGTQRGNMENFFANRSSVAKETTVEKVAIETTEEEQEQAPQIHLVVKDYDREEKPCGDAGTPGKMVSRSLPKCNDLLAALKCNSDPKQNPLGKMIDLINLSERMTAAEIAIEKLSSLIFDLMKKNQELSDLIDENNQQIATLIERLPTVEHEVTINQVGTVTSGASETNLGGGSAGRASGLSPGRIYGEEKGDISAGKDGVGRDGGTAGESGPDGEDGTEAGGVGTGLGGKGEDGVAWSSEKIGVEVSGKDGARASGTNGGIDGEGAGGGDEAANLADRGLPGGTDTGSTSGVVKDDSVVAIYIRTPSQNTYSRDKKKDDLRKDLQDMFTCSGGLATGKMLKHAERELLRKLHLFKSMVFERLIALECDLSRTQKEVKHINDNVEDLLDLFARLSKKVDHFDEFEKSTIEQFLMIQKNIHCLMGEREVRRRQIYDILESIEMVKMIKANTEDLDKIAEQKADKVYADSKVSIKKFNIIQNDLACSIIQTMEKNSAQDIDMANAVKRIEAIMEEKTDICEHNYKVAALNKRIDEVSDILNEMIKLRVCPEGAGTIQNLKHVRCIICNDVVQMKVEEKNPLPCTAALKTKRQFAMQVETECRVGTNPKLTEIIRSRYCGGEYTTMKPNEKVPQKTDFYIDGNVCPPPMGDVYYIEGNDGALYRAQAPDCSFENTNSSHLIKRKASK